jgi:phosphoglycolate phosphatase
MRAQALLFDKDGTLFDFQKTWGPWVGVVIDRLAGGDAARVARMEQVMGYDRASQTVAADSIVIAGTVQQGAASILRFCPDLDLDALMAIFDETGAMAQGVEVLPLAPYLTQLTGMGLRTGVATNDSESTARAQLRRLDLEHRFDFIAGFDSGYGGKPDPGMCLAFAEHIAIAPDQIAMIGDTRHDLDAGRAAGMQCVGVLTGVAGEKDLAPHADVVLSDIGQLISWLG